MTAFETSTVRGLRVGTRQPMKGFGRLGLPLWSGLTLVPMAMFFGFLLVWGSHFGTDLEVYRDGARLWIHGHDPYSHVFTRYRLEFTYPPFALAVFSPIALVPLAVAKWSFWLIDVLAVASAVVIVQRSLKTGWEARTWLWALSWACAAMLLLEPARSGVSFVQVEFALMFLVVADLLGGSGRWRGLGIGMAAAVKLTPAIFILVLVLRRDWLSVRRAVVTFLALTSIAACLNLRVSADYWLRKAFDPSRAGGVTYPGNQCIFAVVHRLHMSSTTTTAIWMLLSALIVAVGVFVAHRCVQSDRPVLAVLCIALVGLLVSPISWTHHWVWLILIPPALVGTRRARDVVPSVRAMLWILVALSVLAPYWWVTSGPAETLLADQLPLWATALLVVWATAEWRRPPPHSAPATVPTDCGPFAPSSGTTVREQTMPQSLADAPRRAGTVASNE
jgi:alpha-1,2-mannosyltransferase